MFECLGFRAVWGISDDGVSGNFGIWMWIPKKREEHIRRSKTTHLGLNQSINQLTHTKGYS